MDLTIFAVLTALSRVCSTVTEVKVTTNFTLQSEESSAENFAACMEASLLFNIISVGREEKVPERAAMSSKVASAVSSSVVAVSRSYSGEKIQKIMSDLKIDVLTVPEVIKRKLIKVVTECLDAFAASNTDFRRR